MRKLFQAYILAIPLFLLMSCNAAYEENSHALSEDQSQSANSTQSPLNSPTPSPTKTRFPTLPPLTQITPSPTPRSIHYEPVPTLLANEVNDYFSSLFNSLGDNSPPSWGPIRLGDTKMEEVQEILGPITSPELIRNETRLGDNEEFFLYSSASWRKRIEDLFVEWVLYGFNDKVQEIHFYINGSPDTLQHFFASYGKPDEVWLTILLPDFAEKNIFIGFFYKYKNIFLWYDMEGEINNNVHQGCGLTFFKMAVWSDMHEKQAVDDLYSAFYPGEARGLREVENLSALTSWEIDTFYEEFRNKLDQEVCISVSLGTSE